MTDDAALDEIFFGQIIFDDPDMQEKYVAMVLYKIEELKKAYPKSYVAELHDNLVAQLVRSSIIIAGYEKDIINHNTGKNTRKNLNDERKHYSDILGKLMSHLKAIIKDKSKDKTASSMFNLEEIS